MEERLVIGIPTCNRPEKLRLCLESVRRTCPAGAEILVVDSGTVSLGPEPLADFQARVIRVDHVIGPAAARQLITRETDHELILFLDDDLTARPGAIDRLLDFITAHPGVQIASGHWVEKGRPTELGQFIEFGLSDREITAFKRFIHPDEAVASGMQAVCCDIPLASLVIRRDAIGHVNFDGRYRFFYEMFDFGMQCKTKGITAFAVVGALFDHDPGGYLGPSLRDDRAPGDFERFVEKWNVIPTGPLRAPIGGFAP
jgi:GT2 family glycosyltransferase